jgi:hypothetical protein
MSTFYQHFGANLPTPNINISGVRFQQNGRSLMKIPFRSPDPSHPQRAKSRHPVIHPTAVGPFASPLASRDTKRSGRRPAWPHHRRALRPDTSPAVTRALMVHSKPHEPRATIRSLGVGTARRCGLHIRADSRRIDALASRPHTITRLRPMCALPLSLAPVHRVGQGHDCGMYMRPCRHFRGAPRVRLAT